MLTSRRGVILLGALLAACSGDKPLGPTSFDVSGPWYWEETLEDVDLGVFCFDSGGIVVTQDGPRFTAGGTQTGFCNSETFSDPFGITDGTINGASAGFRITPCPYTGTLHGTTPDSLTGTVSCNVRAGNQTARLSGTWRFLRDRPEVAPPIVTGDRTGSFTPNIFLLGDTVSITVTASDERDLKFVGYRLGGPAPTSDSIAVSGLTVTHTFALPVTAAMAGTSPLTVFARDRVHEDHRAIPDITVANVRARLARSVALPGTMRDIVYDAKRERLYVSIADSATIVVVNPATATLDPSIALPGNGDGLDLTAGGDSLLVALENRGAFAVVNLVGGGIDTVHIDFDPAKLHNPAGLRITADGQVFVMGTDRHLSGFGAQLVSYDLATGLQQQRTDVGTPFGTDLIITSGTQLFRSGNRTRLLLLQMGVCCPVNGQMYDATAHAFGPSKGTVSHFGRRVTATTSGDLFLLTLDRFTADLSPAGVYTEPEWGFNATAISADGSKAYIGVSFGEWPGFVIRRTTDNAKLEHSFVPGWGQSHDLYTLLPDGLTLISSSTGGVNFTTTLHIVDLR